MSWKIVSFEGVVFRAFAGRINLVGLAHVFVVGTLLPLEIHHGIAALKAVVVIGILSVGLIFGHEALE